MITFLIQPEQGTNQPIAFDLVFHLLQALKFQKWKNGESSFEYNVGEDINEMGLQYRDVVPIGSTEFVTNFIRKHYGKKTAPRNVPECLFHYAKRNIFNGSFYVKSNERIKHSANTLLENMQYSEFVDDIKCEWRAFVFNGQLLDIVKYSGELDYYPDLTCVKQMIKDFINPPPAYTIDVGISKSRGTLLIEAHDFFSCGLYGFEQYDKLPFMLSQTFFYLVR